MSTKSTAEEQRLSTEVAQLWPPQGQWTESDYFKLPESNRIVELTEGEVVIMPPPSFTHQRVLDNLYTAIKSFVRQHDLGITAFAPVAVRLWPGKIREPDILFFSHASRDRIGEMVSGPPDLAVEIISPGTRKTDRHDKFFEYAQAGISEYWLVDPEAATIEIFFLEESAYILVSTAEGGARVRSRLLDGLEVKASSVFE